MVLEVGDPVEGTGLAGAIAAARKKAFPQTYNPSKDPLVKLEAEAIINYLVENQDRFKDIKSFSHYIVDRDTLDEEAKRGNKMIISSKADTLKILKPLLK